MAVISREIRRPVMLTISQVTKAFAGRTLFQDASLQVNRGDRVGLVGPNGAGKSTLFSLILGEASPDDGSISIEKSASIGFLPQENAPAGDETVLQFACGLAGTKANATGDDELDWEIEPKAKKILAGLAFRESDFDRPLKTMSGGWVMRAHLARLLVQEADLLLLDEPTNHLDLESLVWFQDYLANSARTVLGSFLFRGDDVFKTTGVLSGGEKTRLALVKLLLDPPNLLLMDEPTTHLDIGSIDALIGALSQYEGTLLFISHDVYFIRAVAKSVLHINAGKLTPYAGDYDYYLDKTKALSARSALTSGSAPLHNAQPEVGAGTLNEDKRGLREMREERRAMAEQRKAEARARREHEKHVHNLETRILTLEGRQKELSAELEKPETYDVGGAAMQLNRELLAVTQDLARVMQEWESASVAGNGS